MNEEMDEEMETQSVTTESTDQLQDPLIRKEALLQKQNQIRQQKREENPITLEESEEPEAPPKPLRENMISNAIQFLSHPNVKKTPLARQVAFLQNKGLTDEEINEAIKRANGTTSTPTPAVPAPQQSVTIQPLVAPPLPPPLPPPPRPPPPRSTFKSVASTVVLTLGAVGGLYWIWNSFVTRAVDQNLNQGPLSSESQKAPLAEPLKVTHSGPDVDESWKNQMSELVRVVQTQQNEMKDTLKIVNTVLNTPERFTPQKRISDQVDVKELTNAIAALHSFLETNKSQNQSSESLPRNPPLISTPGSSLKSNVTQFPPSTTPLRAANSGQLASASTPVAKSASGHSQSFMDVISKVQAGETIPGIQDIDDSPLDSSAVVTPSDTERKEKPWEARRKQRSSQWEAPPSTGSPSYLASGGPDATKQIPFSDSFPLAFNPLRETKLESPEQETKLEEPLSDESQTSENLNSGNETTTVNLDDPNVEVEQSQSSQQQNSASDDGDNN